MITSAPAPSTDFDFDRYSALAADIENEYRRRTPRSEVLHETSRKFLPGGDTRTVTYFQPYPVFMEAGEGCHLTDVDGHLYLDFLNNHTAAIHGHAHPRITEAVARQIKKGTAYASPTESQVRLAQTLCQRIPSMERVRFCNSGTEAAMNAIRLAKAFTGRAKILKIEGGYHGTHDAVEISVTPQLDLAGPDSAPFSVPNLDGLFKGVVSDVIVAPFNNIQATKQIISRNGDNLAAIIVEPLMGAAGMIPAQSEYLSALKDAAKSHGAILIFDEVMSFRLSFGGAQEIYGVQPDLTVLGKIIGGGFPVGAFGGRADILELLDPRKGRLSHSGTYNGNEVTMMAGLIALELATREEIQRINRLGEQLRCAMQSALADANIEGQVTGVGSLLQIHFTSKQITDYRSASRAAKQLSALMHLALICRGIVIATRGFLCISTPMGQREIIAAASAFKEFLTELERYCR